MMPLKSVAGWSRWDTIGLIAIIIILALLIDPTTNAKIKAQALLAKETISALQDSLKSYKADSGRYPESDAVNSSKPLIEALQGDPKSSPPKKQYYNFKTSRIVNGEFISPFSCPYYYRENASKKAKTPDMHNPDSFDIWTQDSKGNPTGINNWGD